MSRTIDVGAPEFATVRATLRLSQGEFARLLGCSRRTVIRGEQRGIELPSRYVYGFVAESRKGLRAAWEAAKAHAEANRINYLSAAESDALAAILAKCSETTRTEFAEHIKRLAPKPAPVTPKKKRKLARKPK